MSVLFSLFYKYLQNDVVLWLVREVITIFELGTPLTPIFGQIMKFRDAPTILLHITYPKANLFIFYKVSGGGYIYVHPV